ncbi:adhesion G-protein coupled receptor G5-like isoform X1 [Astyanax mexicanus]|uniref:Adhesion G-protein coupled receptor G5-like isoform X1 n=1 Tax=Astyanax mexicanus TaxID=7994 RepID=A0A8T2LDX3_ASTMX|nr:adhesion G-protein coupled receptor G5-like isoform X1 [Astyanax mexicanus]
MALNQQGDISMFSDVSNECHKVLGECQSKQNIVRCLETKMKNCTLVKKLPRLLPRNFYWDTVASTSEATVTTKDGHVIRVPPEAVQRSMGGQQNSSQVHLTVSVLNHSLFKAPSENGSTHEQVLGVWLGEQDVHNLLNPVRMVFVNVNQTGRGECVYWEMSNNSEQGSWSTKGCNTTRNGTDFICECDHLSFFAVLISPNEPDHVDVQRLVYISYVGSSCSVICTAVIIIMFLCQRKRKAEHSVVIHLQLAASLFLLHVFFLSSTFWSQEKDAVCKSLGILLHWALQVTFTWTAIEGFHLYLLLVRVFNIYIRRYVLKLSLVGWGVPTAIVVVCGVTGAYGRFTLTERASNTTVAMDLCWVTNKAVRYITVNGYLGLVLLFNVAILAVMVVKMRQLRVRSVQAGDRVRRIWKDWVTVLGLSCVLGLAWGLAFTTHGPQSISLPGIYLFTILNGFQGVLMLLWFISITWKSVREEQQSTKDLTLSNLNS